MTFAFTVAAPLLLPSATSAPPVGAGPVSVAVPVTGASPATVAGETEIVVKVAALTVRVPSACRCRSR